jgi:CoA:oxalate CoA-transferase
MRPLHGIRVLDVTHIIAGPTCTFWLASLGAEVIRIEMPKGDVTWMTRPFVGPLGESNVQRTARDIPLSPLRKQRGKRNVQLDLRSEAGAEVLRLLARDADVLVENFAPGVMDRRGLGYEQLRSVNPRLVYASITGYGNDGPYRDRAAMDPIVQALSGLMAKTGFPDGPPTRSGATLGDQVPGIWAALGVLAALRQRDLDGEGQFVDVAMLDALVTLMWDEPLDQYEELGLPERNGNGDPRGAPFDTFRCKDGWVAIAAPANHQWKRLQPFLGEAAQDPQWDDHHNRAANRDVMTAFVTAWTMGLTAAEICEQLETAGIPAGPVNPPWWARTDPHVAHRGTLEQLRHPDLDEPTRWLAPVLPVRFSRTFINTTPAEPIGASNEWALRDLLGLDDARIDALRAAGAFGDLPPA